MTDHSWPTTAMEDLPANCYYINATSYATVLPNLFSPPQTQHERDLGLGASEEEVRMVRVL